jgi:hypothetical protein
MKSTVTELPRSLPSIIRITPEPSASDEKGTRVANTVALLNRASSPPTKTGRHNRVFVFILRHLDQARFTSLPVVDSNPLHEPILGLHQLMWKSFHRSVVIRAALCRIASPVTLAFYRDSASSRRSKENGTGETGPVVTTPFFFLTSPLARRP